MNKIFMINAYPIPNFKKSMGVGVMSHLDKLRKEILLTVKVN